MQPNEWCSQDIRGSRVVSAKVAKEDVPKQTCTCHVGIEIDSTTGFVANEFCPIEEIKTVGALNLQRSYPYNDVRVADQEYNIPYELTEAQTASGMFVPSTPTLQICTEHNFENDANRVEIPVIPNPFDPLNPFNPFNPGDPGTSTDPGTTDEENDENGFWFWPFN